MRMESRGLNRMCCVTLMLTAVLLACPAWAVTSKITRQSRSKDLLQGKTEDVVISSRGTIQLGRAAKVLATEFDDVWSVNSIARRSTPMPRPPVGGSPYSRARR